MIKNMQTQISENFKLYELTRSKTADRFNINNSIPSDHILKSAVYLTKNILQPVRDHFGKFTPNSVYRSNELDRVLKHKPLGWISKSQHPHGEAADFEIPGTTNYRLAMWILDNLDFDQLILECYDPRRGPNSGWVHTSLKMPGYDKNRYRVMTYMPDPKTNKLKYYPGLHGIFPDKRRAA